MAGADAKAQLDALAARCRTDSAKSHRSGKTYYFAGYGLILLSVGCSILAGILAFWTEVDRDAVGTVALLPALCATAASQLRLVEKSNWFYRRKRELDALARRIDAATLAAPTHETLIACNAEFDAAAAALDEAWASDLSFKFTGIASPKG